MLVLVDFVLGSLIEKVGTLLRRNSDPRYHFLVGTNYLEVSW
jgi:hypothetical protein